MDDSILLGDVDAWFDSFERGDFAVAWEKQQAALRAQFVAGMNRDFSNIPISDVAETLIPAASLD